MTPTYTGGLGIGLTAAKITVEEARRCVTI